MKKGLQRLARTAFITIIVLMFITGFGLCGIGLVGLDLSTLNFRKLAEVRSIDDLKDWYYGEMGEIVVGEAIVVESVSYDNYAYQQLDDTTKSVYDQIYNCIMEHREKVALVSKDIDVLGNAYEAMIADYGSLFWIKGYQYNTYKSGDTVIGLEFAPKYTMTKEQRDIYQSTIDATADAWLSGIDQNADDFHKALYVFETLIENVDYDLNSEENQNILSVFINKSTVCQGYADAAWYLLDRLGINSTIVSGTANNEAHAWNLVYLDGAYYFMDVTWGNSKYLNLDNSTNKRVNYAYLAMTTEEICQTHIITMDLDIPECLSNADNYYVHEGLYFDRFDVDSIGWTFQKSYEADDDEISIKLSNAELFSQTVNYFFEERRISEYCKGVESIYYIMDNNANVVTIRWK